jgi:hypothetical protein
VKTALSIAVLAAAAALLPAAAGTASGGPRIVFRTVHLATPMRPPELYSVLPSGAGRRLLARGADQPAWSPNRLAFQRGGQVLSMRDGGGDLRYVTRAVWGTNGDPDW